MTDFLTRVAERALGVASMVEPRMPGLFGSIEAPADAARASLDPREPRHHPIGLAAATGPEEPGSKQVPPPAGEGPRAARAVREVMLDPARPPRAVLDRGRLLSIQDAPAAPQPGAPTRTRETSEATSQGAGGTGAAGPPDAGRVSLATGRDDPARVAPVDTLVPATTARYERPLEREPALAAAARALNREQGPVVRITIGRVDVRASVPTPAPRLEPRPRAADRQRLSLAEYLKRGGNGGAR